MPTSEPRPTVVSLELLLDPATEALIRAEWQALADAKLSSLAAHTSPSNRPHITLLVRPSLPEVSLAEVRNFLPLPLTLGALLLFGEGDRRVLARSIVPSVQLLELHRALHDLVEPGEDAPHTQSDEWVPHITLARRMRVDALPQALRLLDGVSPAASGSATGIRRWDAATATVTDLLG